MTQENYATALAHTRQYEQRSRSSRDREDFEKALDGFVDKITESLPASLSDTERARAQSILSSIGHQVYIMTPEVCRGFCFNKWKDFSVQEIGRSVLTALTVAEKYDDPVSALRIIDQNVAEGINARDNEHVCNRGYNPWGRQLERTIGGRFDYFKEQHKRQPTLEELKQIITNPAYTGPQETIPRDIAYHVGNPIAPGNFWKQNQWDDIIRAYEDIEVVD